MKQSIFKFFVTFGVLALSIGCKNSGLSQGEPDSTPSPIVEPDPIDEFSFPLKIEFSGIGEMGLFDPSLQTDPTTGKVWMAYSAVDPFDSSPDEYKVHSRLAYSDDGGVNWTDLGANFASPEHNLGFIDFTTGTLEIPDGTPGAWLSETTDIHYDPWAPEAERWKLIWMNYLRVDLDTSTPNTGANQYAGFGWLATKAAATPEGLLNASPEKFMNNFGYEAEANTSGAPDFPPITGTPLINPSVDFAADDPDNELDFCVMSEPSFHPKAEALYLVMGCHALLPTPVVAYQILFKCSRPCNYRNASSWSYLGRIISPADAQNLNAGYSHYNGSDIFEYQDETYLVSTPESSGYAGCDVSIF